MVYVGEVDWRRPSYDLVQFEDSGEMSVTDTTVTISPLFPGTNYLIRVSAVTQSGRGAEVTRYGTTRTSQDGKERQCNLDELRIRVYSFFREVGLLSASDVTSFELS